MLVKCQTSHLRRAQQSLRSQLPHRFVSHRTHEILNVSREFVNVNIYEADPSIRRSVAAFTNSDPSTVELLHNHGALCGSRALIETGVLAERNRPVLRQFDTFGRRIDVVDFHPSYHELMSLAKEVGTASYGYVHENASPDSHVVRGVLSYLQGQVDPGHGCPITMTNAAIPVLSRIPGCADLVRKLRHQSYDPRDVPMSEKQSITAGMSMTEKQGGSDVRANTTMATPADGGKTGQGAGYYLTGHKVRYSGYSHFVALHPNSFPFLL
jgi:putative acyl-CoA dehydrogenase